MFPISKVVKGQQHRCELDVWQPCYVRRLEDELALSVPNLVIVWYNASAYYIVPQAKKQIGVLQETGRIHERASDKTHDALYFDSGERSAQKLTDFLNLRRACRSQSVAPIPISIDEPNCTPLQKAFGYGIASAFAKDSDRRDDSDRISIRNRMRSTFLV